jgi:hypothetical protein
VLTKFNIDWYQMVAMSIKRQYNVRLEGELIDGLDEAAVYYGRESGNRVAAEVIENYFSLWRQAEDARLDVLRSQGVRVESGALLSALGPGGVSEKRFDSRNKPIKPQRPLRRRRI